VPRDTNPFETEVLADDVIEAWPNISLPPAPRPETRRFLIIAGPFGAFTRRLGEALREAGAPCERVLLNAGDAYDWGTRHVQPYFGPFSGWSAWLFETVRRHGVTDLILYGDAHPYCKEAVKVAARIRLRVHVLEQGYFRPFWVTLERGGVNGNSALPRDPLFYRAAGRWAPEPAEIWLPPLTPPAARRITAYHAALILGAPAFPRFHAPYAYPILRQALGHTRRYLGQKLFRGRHQRRLAAALDTSGPLFLGILQRPGDSQLRIHSDLASTADFVELVVSSFARKSPAEARLLFKSHPLDHGLEPHARTIAEAAKRFEVTGRVFFADTGDLEKIFPKAAGAVTVNSTAGLSAIEKGLPTLTLGTAIYDMAGLTHQRGLDTFWTAPQKPDPSLYQAFRRVVIERTQVSGAYASNRGVEFAAPEVARRLLAA